MSGLLGWCGCGQHQPRCPGRVPRLRSDPERHRVWVDGELVCECPCHQPSAA